MQVRFDTMSSLVSGTKLLLPVTSVKPDIPDLFNTGRCNSLDDISLEK